MSAEISRDRNIQSAEQAAALLAVKIDRLESDDLETVRDSRAYLMSALDDDEGEAAKKKLENEVYKKWDRARTRNKIDRPDRKAKTPTASPGQIRTTDEGEEIYVERGRAWTRK